MGRYAWCILVVSLMTVAPCLHLFGIENLTIYASTCSRQHIVVCVVAIYEGQAWGYPCNANCTTLSGIYLSGCYLVNLSAYGRNKQSSVCIIYC